MITHIALPGVTRKQRVPLEEDGRYPGIDGRGEVERNVEEEGREGALITIRRVRHRTCLAHGAVTVKPLEEIPFPKSNHHPNTGCKAQSQ